VTTATLPQPLFAAREAAFAPAGGGELTLDERVVAVLEDLALRERAPCLVCGGELSPAGRCADCGSSLS
jgi:hypothetical protein